MSTTAKELFEYFNSGQLGEAIARMDGKTVNYGKFIQLLSQNNSQTIFTSL